MGIRIGLDGSASQHNKLMLPLNNTWQNKLVLLLTCEILLSRLQVAARSRPVVPGGRLPADCSDTNALDVRRTYTRLGDRSFPVAGPTIWKFARIIATA